VSRKNKKGEFGMFERFTDDTRKVMALANKQAQQFGHGYIRTEHILLGLLKESSSTGATILKDLGVDIDKLLSEVEQLLKSRADKAGMEKPPQSDRAINVIKYAIEEAKALEHNYIGTEHILLGLLRETDGIAAQVLTNLKVKLQDVREKAKEIRRKT
jgi:ATP-dependent Clp protease ATP-binding subunit ClpC